LNERLRHTGAELAMEIIGDLDRVPTTASREAYRIIRESLTNALRHGGSPESGCWWPFRADG
jgi:signal transduction histidine kinase